jgi:hypothetical protein
MVVDHNNRWTLWEILSQERGLGPGGTNGEDGET